MRSSERIGFVTLTKVRERLGAPLGQRWDDFWLVIDISRVIDGHAARALGSLIEDLLDHLSVGGVDVDRSAAAQGGYKHAGDR
jgi:hypothetical protein